MQRQLDMPGQVCRSKCGANHFDGDDELRLEIKVLGYNSRYGRYRVQDWGRISKL